MFHVTKCLPLDLLKIKESLSFKLLQNNPYAIYAIVEGLSFKNPRTFFVTPRYFRHLYQWSIIEAIYHTLGCTLFQIKMQYQYYIEKHSIFRISYVIILYTFRTGLPIKFNIIGFQMQRKTKKYKNKI